MQSVSSSSYQASNTAALSHQRPVFENGEDSSSTGKVALFAIAALLIIGAYAYGLFSFANFAVSKIFETIHPAILGVIALVAIAAIAKNSS